MTVLDQDSLEVSSTMPDAFGTSSPTTEVGLEKQAGQSGFFVFIRTSCVIHLKDAAGAWNQYAGITVTEDRSLTIPWGDNTAVFFECTDTTATFHVYRKTGSILWLQTPRWNLSFHTTSMVLGELCLIVQQSTWLG
jgi:hypothetical protein